MPRQTRSVARELSTETIPDDQKFVCLTLGPSVFGAAEGRPAYRLHNASIYFKSPIALGDHWPQRLGSFTLDKLYKTRFAVAASDTPINDSGPDRAARIVEGLETRAYNGLRALLIQGNPFEIQVAGLEIRRVSDAGRSREEAAFMRPRTSHPWETISSIDDSALATAATVARSLEKIVAQPYEFSRLQRGLDHWDQATMEHRVDLRLHALVRAIEALIAPERGRTQGQFVDRCKTFVQAARTDRLLNEIYELRSQVEHSNDWRLAFQETRPSLSDEDAELLAMLRALQVEQMTRSAYLRVLLDPSFLESFRTDESIRGFWASRDRARMWGDPMNLESEIRRVFDPHKAEIFEKVTKIDFAQTRFRAVRHKAAAASNEFASIEASPSGIKLPCSRGMQPISPSWWFRSAAPFLDAAPTQPLISKRAEPIRARPSSRVVAKLLLDLRLPRPCCRPIAFTETRAASAILPLDETRSQVVAPAIAANQPV